MDKVFNKNKLIGNNGENIVEFLINSMPNWKCSKFGVENHIKEIRDMVGKVISPVTLKLKLMPDFFVFNEETKEAFFVEVKYRTKHNEGYLFNYLENYNKYWAGTKLIIVRQNKPHFAWVDLEKINPSMMKMDDFCGERKAFWDFGELEKDIKTLFPDLDDEDIIEAEGMIPKRE